MEIFEFLNPPNKLLFYSRGEKGDVRMGDVVLRNRVDFKDIDVAIVGVPVDEGVERNKGRPGARYAPDEIRKYLYKFTPFNFKTKKQITELKIFDLGNIKPEGTLEEIHEKLRRVVFELVKNKITPIVLGGGHDIAFPDYMGFAENFEKRALINIDTHLDVRESAESNSGTPFREILESKLKPEKFFEVGIQNYANSAEHLSYAQKKNAKIIYLEEVKRDGVEKIFKNIKGEINETPVFVSFDMDSVRSSDAPGVSASYPDGITASEILEIAFFSGKNFNVKIIDIAEVNPNFDVDGKTSKLASLVILNFLSGFANK